MQINKALANQAIDKLLSTGDARLRRFGGRIFRSLQVVTTIDELRDLVRKAISSLESDIGEVRTEFHESVIAKMKGLQAQCESRYLQLLRDKNEVILDVLGLQIDVPIEIAGK